MSEFKKIIKLIIFGGVVMPFYSISATTGVTEQASAMDSSLKQEAAACAQGETPGTIGYAIKQAIAAHTDIASATPNVESLFNVSSDCFSGVSNMFDLSFAIPSIGSIMASAESAVEKYAAKKACSAVDQISGMVTSPINSAIDNVKKYDSIDNALSGEMSKLDPSLGSGYHGSNSTSYNINVNPFNSKNNTLAERSASPTSFSLPSVSNSASDSKSESQSSSDSGDNYLQSVGSLFK